MRIMMAACLLTASALAQDPTPTPGPVPRPEPGATTSGEPEPTPPPVDPAVIEMLARTHDGLTVDELEAFIKADGYAYERLDGNSGPYIQTRTVNGVTYEVWLSECNTDAVPRCIGLNAQTFYFKESPKVTLKALNDWNANTWGMRAMLFPDGQSAMTMNIGVNGGVTGNWVIKRLRNFNYWAEAYNAFWETGNPKAAPPE